MKCWNFFVTDVYMYAYTTVCIDTMYRTLRSIWIYRNDADTDLAASWPFSKVYTVHVNKRPLPLKLQWMITFDYFNLKVFYPQSRLLFSFVGFFNKPNHPDVKYQEDSYMFVMAGCSRNDFFCITFSFPLWQYQLFQDRRNWTKEKMRDFTLGIFLSVADVSKNRKPNVNLFVLSLWMKHVHNEVDNVWWWTQLPVVRDVWWGTQLPGVTRNRCKRYWNK